MKSDFRAFLREEFIRRSKQNSKYSLRSFARFLDVEPSRLSKMLRGLRPIGPTWIEQFGIKLRIPRSRIEGFKVSPPIERGRGTERSKAVDYKQISLATFEVISDWHHYALLELMKLDEFRTDVKWIAAVLNSNTTFIRACVERLVRIGLLEISRDGVWTDRSNGFTTDVLGLNATSQAHRLYQEMALEKAREAVSRVSIERRTHSTIMMATRLDKVEEAKKMIGDFRRELCAFLEDCDGKDSVYLASFALFPVTEKET